MSGARHYNNVGGRTPFGTPDKHRLQVFNDRVHRTQEWTKIYVEGLPQQVMMAQRGGIPHLRETIEDIMDWPLADGTDFILAETAITRRYPTEHGRHGNAATYGLTLELGKGGLRTIDPTVVWGQLLRYSGEAASTLRPQGVQHGRGTNGLNYIHDYGST